MSTRPPLAPGKAKVKTQLAICAVLIAATVLISLLAGYSLGLSRGELAGSPELGPIDTVSSEDAPGEDVPGVQGYPNAVRVE